jgi:hypothetical protein
MHSLNPSPVFAFSGEADTLQQLAPLLSTGQVLVRLTLTVDSRIAAGKWLKVFQAAPG